MRSPQWRAMRLVSSTVTALLVVAAMSASAFAAEPSPTPVPNPGPSGTPAPGPSYSPPPIPKPPETRPPASAILGSAATDRLLARAEGAAFSSSFEAGDPQPTWTDTPEVGPDGRPKSANITGALPGGIPGSLADKVVEIAASGENTGRRRGQGEPQRRRRQHQVAGVQRARLGAVQARPQPVAVVHYALTSANDAPGRDPRDWTLQGSRGRPDLDHAGHPDRPERSRRGSRPRSTGSPTRSRTRTTGLTSPATAATASSSSPSGNCPAVTTGRPPPSDMRSQVGTGPDQRLRCPRPRAGFTGLKALQYAGRHDRRGGRLLVQQGVRGEHPGRPPTTELSYVVFPEFTAATCGYPSTLRRGRPGVRRRHLPERTRRHDQHGAVLSPRGQGESKTLYADQWNYKQVDRSARSPAARRSSASSSRYDNPVRPGRLPRLARRHPDHRCPRRRRTANGPRGAKPSDYAVTTRGTHSTGGFSRGNNFPATAVPHGFNFWTPMTNAGSTSWLYEYHREQQRDEPAARCRRSRPATSRARGWATGRPSR